MVLDQGNVVIVIQVVALVLLTIGVYPYRIRLKNRNLIMHGFLSIIALVLNVFTIFYAMIPTFGNGISLLGELSILEAVVVWLHVGIGVAAVALGFVIIVSWVIHPLGELGCSKTWRLMIPAFAFWAFVLILGVIIHFLDVL